MTTPVSPTQQRPLFTRGRAVMLAILSGAVALILGTQTWITASDIVALPDTIVTVSGQEAAAVIPAMALVAIASGIALSIAGRIARVLIGALLFCSGVLMGMTTVSVVMDPARFIAPTVADLSGLTDPAQSVHLAWPSWVGLVAALLLACSGLVVLVFGHRWAMSSRKYDTAPAEKTSESSLKASKVAPSEEPYRDEVHRRSQQRIDDIDAWDELTRGNDPT